MRALNGTVETDKNSLAERADLLKVRDTENDVKIIDLSRICWFDEKKPNIFSLKTDPLGYCSSD